MGQSITVEAKPAEGFCVFTTDRSLSGQDGISFSSPAEADGIAGFPAELAVRLFSSDDAIDHVYVASNDVVVRRTTQWGEASVESAARIIEGLFRFYAD